MTKQEYLSALRNKLKGLPSREVEEKVEFYSEMIDDYMVEGGISEEEAVSKIGAVEDVSKDIINETPLVNIVKEKYKPKRRLSGLEIFLLVLGFPLWFPLLITFMVLAFVIYLLTWVLTIVLFAVDLALIVAGGGAIVAGFANMAHGNLMYACFLGGVGAISIGVGILFYFLAKESIKLSFGLSKKLLLSVKLGVVSGGKDNENN